MKINSRKIASLPETKNVMSIVPPGLSLSFSAAIATEDLSVTSHKNF